MAPRKSRRSSSARKPRQSNAKPGRGNRKTKRTFTATSPVEIEVSAVAKGADQPPNGPDRFAENRLDSPYSISLNNLVRLDWQHRREMFPHGPGVTKLEQLGLKGRPYTVESLEPGTTGDKFVYLYPEKRYYVVPIYEEGQSLDSPQRFLLVRSRMDKDEQGPHIFVVEPLEPPASSDPYAHLHIIGGEDDSTPTDSLQHTAGIVEAVLTAVETMPGQTIEPSAAPSPQPVASSVPSVNDPLVKDLLSRIDVLSIAQSSRSDAAHDFDVAHTGFLDYVQRHYGLEHIPITLGQTKFDPALGHYAAATANDSSLSDGVIVGISRDGYSRDHQIVREAHVVVNKPDGTAARPQDKSQTTTLKPSTPPETPQHLDEPDDTLLRCIDNFNQALGYSPASKADLIPLRDCLLSYLRQKYGWERIPIRINETLFDEKIGHYSVNTANLRSVPDGAIVAVQSDGYMSGGKVAREAQVIVNRVPELIARLNKLVPLSRKQMYLEIVARQDMIINEVILDAANQVGVIDMIYSLLTIFANASPSRIRYLAEQLSSGKATSSLIRENLGRTPLHLRYLRRTPEIYVALRGAVEPLDALRQILIAEATRRDEKNYYLQAGRTWLDEILRQLRSDGPIADDYTAFVKDVSQRLEQITFTAEFATNTSQ